MQTSGVESVFDALAVNLQEILRDMLRPAILACLQVKMSPEDAQRLKHVKKQKGQKQTNKLSGAAFEVCHSAPGFMIDCCFIRF